MACVYPIECWRKAKRSERGKQGITFKIAEANIDEPLLLPCGKCINCTKHKSRTWGVRIAHEAQQYAENSFLTLTYKNAPNTLCKRDLQLFFKRLRHRGAIRYFAVGEYGARTRRPHYHAIIFGQDFRNGAYKLNDNLYGNAILDTDWGYGWATVGDVTQESIMYVAGYTNKKIGDPDTFNLMSRKPPIGKTWLDQYKNDLLKGKVIINGQQYPIPEAYFKWEEDYLSDLKNKRIAHIKNQTPDEKWFRRTKLRDQEINAKAKLKQVENQAI